MPLTEFIIDQYYTNEDISKSLSLANFGGVRPKLSNGELQLVVIFTTADEANMAFKRNPYADRVEGDLLIYTAAGLKGNQSLSGVNKRIVEQYQRLVPILGFSNEGKGKGRRFLGLLELLRHYQETQIDSDRNLRQAWIFEFRIHRGFKLVPIASATEFNEAVIKESRRKIRKEERGEVKLAEIEGPYLTQQAVPVFNMATLEETRSKLLSVNPYAFENLIKDALERNGFYRVDVTRKSGDGGIDLNSYLNESHYFLKDTFVQFQAKRWKHSVGRKEIAEFRGSLKSPLGVFVTTSHFTTQAQLESQEVGHKPVMLIDGLRFSEIVLKLDVPLEKYLP